MSASPQPRMTPEQYLEFERAAEFRHEYYDGVVYAMSGGSTNHAILMASVTAALYSALRKRPCTLTTADLRLRVTPDGLYTYPGIMVHCGEAQFADGRKDILLNPTVVIEVLSPSTEAYDRGASSFISTNLSSHCRNTLWFRRPSLESKFSGGNRKERG
jgi:Uma2 family endonuclease